MLTLLHAMALDTLLIEALFEWLQKLLLFAVASVYKHIDLEYLLRLLRDWPDHVNGICMYTDFWSQLYSAGCPLTRYCQ